MHDRIVGKQWFLTSWSCLLIAASAAWADDSALLGGGSGTAGGRKAAAAKESGKPTAKNSGKSKKPESKSAVAPEALVETPTVHYVTLMIARDPAVQAELRVSRKQAAEIKAAIAAVDEPFWLLRDVPVKQCADKLDALLARLQADLKASLSATQFDRLNQITLQARGWKAVVAPDVAQKLRLSPEQVEKLRGVIAQILAKRAEAESQKSKAADPETQRDVESNLVFKLLSSKQQEALTDAVGSNFDHSQLKQIGCVAPELRGVEAWINSEPLSLSQLRGKVVVVHFWTFGCINCIHNLPHYQAWHKKFRPSDVTIIGLHTPETSAERDVNNVRAKVKEFGIAYPVAFDAAAENWKAWGNNMWPSVYLIDKNGNIRGWWTGEMAWEGAHGEEIMRAKIEKLIAEE